MLAHLIKRLHSFYVTAITHPIQMRGLVIKNYLLVIIITPA